MAGVPSPIDYPDKDKGGLLALRKPKTSADRLAVLAEILSLMRDNEGTNPPRYDVVILEALLLVHMELSDLRGTLGKAKK